MKYNLIYIQSLKVQAEEGSVVITCMLCSMDVNSHDYFGPNLSQYSFLKITDETFTIYEHKMLLYSMA